MTRPFINWRGLWLVVAIAAMTNLIPAASQAQITFLNNWGSLGSGNTQFEDPNGVAVGPTGQVYVADAGNQRVQVFDSAGGYQSTIGTTNNPGSGNNQFDFPLGIAVGPTGTIYVADGQNNRVQVFNPSGAYQSTIGTGFGPGNNQFSSPAGVAIGPTSTVYVSDDGNQRVQVFDSAGGYQSTIGITNSPGSGSNQFDFPFGMAVGPTGMVYVADSSNNRVQVFNSSGVYQSTIGTTGSGNGQFNSPSFVAVGPTGTVYVTDSGNERVQVFNSAGVWQTTISSVGSGNNQFDLPRGVAVAPTGMVYVADTLNNRIVRYFDPNSWTSGTNTFTDPTVGPTSVNVGPGQIMGTSLTLNSAMGLVVGSTVSVYSGGSLTLAGGSLTAPFALVVSGSFTYQTGSLSASAIYLGGFFQATQGGQLSTPSGVSIAGPGEMLLDGGTSLTTETVSMQDGGLLALGNATVSVTSASIPFRIFGGEVQLQNANTSIINTPQLLIEGGDGAALLDGSGRINGQLQIYSGTEASVASGQTMTITGTGNLNHGLLSLTGGTFHFTQDLTNTGAIEGIGTLRVDGGLTNLSGASIALGGLGPAYVFGTINNSGTLSLAGSAGVFGTVANNASGGTIHLSGNTPNVFYGAVANGGAINIDAGAIGLFYGGVTGSGTITNSGSAQFDATSTAVAVSGTGNTSLVSSVTLNASSFTQGGLTLQLGGDTTGTYSKLDVTGALNLAGKLTVNLVNGFTPAMGNSFDLMDWSTISGHFSSLVLPALSGSLEWNTKQLYTNGAISVIDSNYLPGDINRDGVVNVADISALMIALADMSKYQSMHPDLVNNPLLFSQVVDVNQDGFVDNADIQALITLVANNIIVSSDALPGSAVSGGEAGAGTAPPVTAVPEPAAIVLFSLSIPAFAGFARLRRGRLQQSLQFPKPWSKVTTLLGS